MLKTDRSSQFDDVTPWSTEFCRRSRWFWSSASSESKIVVKFLHNDLKWPFPYSIPRNPQIINFNVLRLTKNNYNSYSNLFFLNNEMFTTRRFMRNTMQRHCRKKFITRFIIVQSHSGPPTSTPLNIFYIRACCPHHNENSCAYQRRKRHNCQYLSKFTTETYLSSWL